MTEPGIERRYDQAMSAVERYEDGGDPAVLDEAAALAHEAVALAEGTEFQCGLYASLAYIHLTRYFALSDPTDLDAAMDGYRRALDLSEEADRGPILLNLGVVHRAHYDLTGDLDSLDLAISAFRASAEGGRAVVRLSNLGAALFTRFEHLGDNTDLAEAERVLSHAVAETEPRTRDGDTARSNLVDVLAALAVAFDDESRLAEAFDLADEVYRSRRDQLGPRHQDTLASRAVLIALLARSGNAAAAEGAYRALVVDTMAVFGPDHPVTLACRHNLATVMVGADHPADAVTVLEQLVSDLTRVLGSHHPDTLTTRFTLATTYLALDRLEQTETTAYELLTDQLTVLGEDHEAIGLTRELLATAERRATSSNPVAAELVVEVLQHARTTEHRRLELRDLLRDLLLRTLKQAGVNTGVRSDGDRLESNTAIGDVAVLVNVVPRLLARALWELNLDRPGYDWLRLSLAVDTRPISAPVSRGVREEASLLGTVVVLVSDTAYQAATEPELFKPAGSWWIRSVGYRDERTTGRPVSSETLARLVDAVLGLNALRDPATRETLASEFHAAVDSGRVRDHAVALVDRCLRTGSLPALVDRLRELEGPSPAMRELDGVLLRELPAS
ncbi:tetratricopeptide repeat protein [Actinokineospora inagensis]|uniref:tetratricopeptide repeat protein n=1 Tax=Actinokineospora inagensis TaxID=103730 RepID=UPI00042157CB|nr:tetratricopeptide repeat protein [Actinokineospora inagensis]